MVAELKKLQYARTGVADPNFYDDAFCFADGNPAPHGTPEEILAAGREMYHALSPETAEFIDEMFDGGLFDVLSKEGKAPETTGCGNCPLAASCSKVCEKDNGKEAAR